MLGHCLVKYRNKQKDPGYTGKENYLEDLDFNSLCSSAMEKALPTGEISLCDDKCYSRSISSSSASSFNIGYINTIDTKHDDELEQRTKKYPFFFGNKKS